MNQLRDNIAHIIHDTISEHCRTEAEELEAADKIIQLIEQHAEETVLETPFGLTRSIHFAPATITERAYELGMRELVVRAFISGELIDDETKIAEHVRKSVDRGIDEYARQQRG